MASRPKTSPATTPSKTSWRRDERRRAPPQPPSVPEEHGAGEVVAVGELGRRSLEAHLALLEEDGPVGDRQRDVERLLDDDDRHALAP